MAPLTNVCTYYSTINILLIKICNNYLQEGAMFIRNHYVHNNKSHSLIYIYWLGCSQFWIVFTNDIYEVLLCVQHRTSVIGSTMV